MKNNIDYDELLNIWFDKVKEEWERADELADEEYYTNPYSFKQGKLEGYSNGLVMATSILSNLERKEEIRINNMKKEYPKRKDANEVNKDIKENDQNIEKKYKKIFDIIGDK